MYHHEMNETIKGHNADNHDDGKNYNTADNKCSSDPRQSRSPQFSFFSWVPWQRNTGDCRMEADNSKHNGAAHKIGG